MCIRDRYLEANQRTRQSDLRAIDQHIVRVQESLVRLHSGVQRVEVKVDQMGLQLDSFFAEISQAEVNVPKLGATVSLTLRLESTSWVSC